MRTLNKQQLEDLILGCSILATGGGGSPTGGLNSIYIDLDAGRQFTMIDLDEVPDEALVAAPYGCGCIAPEDEKTASLSDEIVECLTAVKAMEKYLGEGFRAAMASEIGGGNTAVALCVAARMGIPIVDADPSGRSVPQLNQSTFYIKNVPIAPIAVATAKGDVMILEQVSDDFRAEEIVRAIAVVSGNQVGAVDHPVRGRILRESVIPGTLSKALRIGEAVRQAQMNSADPVRAAVEAGGGYLLFTGEVSQTSWEIRDGFTIGELVINGRESYRGHLYRIWYKNEHMISWYDGQPDVSVPDLICMLNVHSGEPIINPNAKQGMKVAVIGYPAPDIWRSPRGLEVFGPRSLGYDIDYQKIEENERLC